MELEATELNWQKDFVPSVSLHLRFSSRSRYEIDVSMKTSTVEPLISKLKPLRDS